MPSVYAVIQLLDTYKDRLFFYLDLHAHANINNVFMFGNSLPFKSHVESCLFPLLMAVNCNSFCYESCNFSIKNMSDTDKGENKNKDGTGRVAIMRRYNLVHSYTLEANYNMCNLHAVNLP
jgi:hypothetical protein